MRSAEKNPFRVEKIESLAWSPVPETCELIFKRWQAAAFKGQLVGTHGSGKTTLALELRKIAEEQSFKSLYLFANAESLKSDFRKWQMALEKADDDTLIIFDGIGHAPFWQRRGFLKRTPRFLSLVHQPIKKVDIVCHLQPQEDLLLELCEKLAGQEGLQLIEKAGGVKALLRRQNNNLRQCFFELYDLWSEG